MNSLGSKVGLLSTYHGTLPGEVTLPLVAVGPAGWSEDVVGSDRLKVRYTQSNP